MSRAIDVEHDDRDDIFVGRVLGLLGIVSFDGKTVAKLRRQLVMAIKDSLGDCEELEASQQVSLDALQRIIFYAAPF